jgi:hypothetical protein
MRAETGRRFRMRASEMMRTPAVICAPTATVDVHADVAEAAATMMKRGVALDDLVRASATRRRW